MTKTEAKVVTAWRKAATDLGFVFTAPFFGISSDGKQFEALGLVHKFGGKIGTIISVGGEPSADKVISLEKGYGGSCLGRTGYTRYNRASWIEMLDDWGYWGDLSSAPNWYKPGPHCH